MPPTSIDGTDITGATIDGTEVEEITVDGQIVFSAVPNIPDSVVSHYTFEDQGDPVTDTISNNDLSISDASYTTTSHCGDYAMDFNGSDSELNGPTVDLVSQGDSNSLAIGGFAYTRSTDDQYIFAYNSNQDNTLFLEIDSGNIIVFLQEGGTNVNLIGPSVSTNTWQHLWVDVGPSTAELFIDGSSTDSVSHGLDINQIGAGQFQMGYRDYTGSFPQYYDGIIDNATYANGTLGESGISDLIELCN